MRRIMPCRVAPMSIHQTIASNCHDQRILGSMDDEALYRVVFSGLITEEYDLKTTKRRFAKVFRQDAKRTQLLFSGKEHAIKSNVTEQVATDFAIKLMEIGCECYVELMPLADDISQQPGFVERRLAVRRRQYRRDPRPGSIVPDRRLLLSRRRVDMILEAKGLDFPGKTVAK